MLRTRFWPITARPISPMSQLGFCIGLLGKQPNILSRSNLASLRPEDPRLKRPQRTAHLRLAQRELRRRATCGRTYFSHGAPGPEGELEAGVRIRACIDDYDDLPEASHRATARPAV